MKSQISNKKQKLISILICILALSIIVWSQVPFWWEDEEHFVDYIYLFNGFILLISNFIIWLSVDFLWGERTSYILLLINLLFLSNYIKNIL